MRFRYCRSNQRHQWKQAPSVFLCIFQTLAEPGNTKLSRHSRDELDCVTTVEKINILRNNNEAEETASIVTRNRKLK